MPHKMLNSPLLVLGIVVALGAQTVPAQGTFPRADIDSAGQLRIVLSSGRVIRLPKDSDQVAFEQVVFSANHRIVGWLALYPN